jgi:hypothetical protein
MEILGRKSKSWLLILAPRAKSCLPVYNTTTSSYTKPYIVDIIFNSNTPGLSLEIPKISANVL